MTSFESMEYGPEPEKLPDAATHGESCREESETDPGDTTITDELLILCAAGNREALERLHRGSIRWLSERIQRTEQKNLSLWGSIVIDDIPQDIVSRVVGKEGAKLRLYATFDRPAAGYFKAMQTALTRRITDANRRWRTRGSRHVPLTAGTEGGEAGADRPTGSLQVGLPDPAEQAAVADLAALIDRVATTALTEEEFGLLRSEIEGVPRSQLAGRAGVSESAIATRVCRIRKKLRDALNKELQ